MGVKAIYEVMDRGSVVKNTSRGPIVNRVVKFINHSSVKELCFWFVAVLVVLSILVSLLMRSTGSLDAI